MHSLDETLMITAELGEKKVKKTLLAKWILGFIGGAMIAIGYMAFVILSSNIPGGMGQLLGASVFPIGLIVILFAGGELITGNMMVVATSFFSGKVTLKELANNWLVITLANIVGAMFVSYVFGIYLGILTPHQETLVKLAQGKVHYDPLRTLVSGIGCNWFVGLACWLSYAGKDGFGKFIGVWFPIMVFVLLGFQHSVANTFLLSAENYFGAVSISEFAMNFIFSYIGNIIGGAVFVGLFYKLCQSPKPHNQ